MTKQKKLFTLGLIGLTTGLLLTGCTEKTITNQKNNIKDLPVNIESTKNNNNLDKEAQKGPVSTGESKTSEEFIDEKLNADEYIISNTFDLSLYKHLSMNNNSFCVSPYSIKDCFSILYPALKGDSRDEIDTVMNFDERSDVFYSNYDEDYVDDHLLIANKGFINEKLEDEINEDLLNVNNIDYIIMDESGVDSINEFVSDNTNKYIENLISSSDVDDETVAVLVNALYFKNEWRDSYDTGFVTFNGNNVESFTGELDFIDVKELNDNVDLIRLRYNVDSPADNQYSLYVFDSTNGNSKDVDNYFNSLTDSDFAEILDFESYMGIKGYDEVKFNIPVFESEFKSELNSVLNAMGIEAPFNNADDFAELGKDITIDKVIHGAYIYVNSEGTEAAASTAITMAKGAAPIDTGNIKEVIVDSDFTYVLKDDTNNVVLFMGRHGE